MADTLLIFHNDPSNVVNKYLLQWYAKEVEYLTD